MRDAKRLVTGFQKSAPNNRFVVALRIFLDFLIYKMVVFFIFKYDFP